MAENQDLGSWRYLDDLPADKSGLAKAWTVLERYSGIPPDEIEAHVKAIVTYAVRPYPCLGRWAFLRSPMTELPEYPTVLARLRAPGASESLLDVGCCFGQVLRRLVVDGVPPAALAGTDLRPEFIELGYELFRDRDRDDFAGVRFVAGDLLSPDLDGPDSDPDAEGLRTFDGGFDIVHAASLFHLFGWDDQVRLGERIVRFFKPDATGALLLGTQIGVEEPLSTDMYREAGEGTRYHHNIESFQKLWDVIGDKTGTKWRVTGNLAPVNIPGIPTNWRRLSFAVSKVQ
ncbi:hypothetical protein B0J18DRAFT_375651 [Chaetomium sp. MPI-SDFR-AT-0129]|nr:hypothetical protein B0J18DRAFT_375651 [Chaetomium sp. MPI-SDFR-AT-0129]